MRVGMIRSRPKQAESVDVDRRTVGVGRIHAGVVIVESQEGFAGKLRVDQQRIAQCHPEIVGVDVPAAAVGDQRSELRILAVQAGPVDPREQRVSIPHRVVNASQELLAFLPERKDPAVLLEQGDEVGIVSRRQSSRELVQQRPRDQPRRAQARHQGLLRGGQFVQERVVPQQRNEDRFVAVQPFIGAVEKRSLPSQRSADRGAALRSGIGRFFRIEVVAGLDVAVAEQPEQAAMQLAGTALGDDVDGAAGRAAQLGRKRVSVHLELLHRRLGDGGADRSRVEDVVQAVQHEGIVSPAAPPNAQPGMGRDHDSAVPVIDHIIRADHSRRQQSQIQIVPAVDGEVLDADGVDIVGLRRLMGVDRRALADG